MANEPTYKLQPDSIINAINENSKGEIYSITSYKRLHANVISDKIVYQHDLSLINGTIIPLYCLLNKILKSTRHLLI